MKKIFYLLFVLFGLANFATAQNVRWDYSATTTTTTIGNLIPLYVIPRAAVSFYVGCSSLPCSTPAATFNSRTSVSSCPANAQIVLQTTSACVSNSDLQGNFGAWFASGEYQYTITYNGVVNGPYDFNVGGSGSGGAGNPAAPGGSDQFGNVTANGFASGGKFLTDVFISGAGNDGVANFQDSTACTTTSCFGNISNTSGDTEEGQPLPVLGEKVSSFVEDNRQNSLGLYFTNPIPQDNASTHYPLIAPSQTGRTEMVAYPNAFPPGIYSEGSSQNGQIQITNCTIGFSNGPANRDISPGLFDPLPGYPDTSAWAGCGGQLYIFNKNEAGIGQSQTFFLNCVGGGDCQGQAWFAEYAGGCMSDSDECWHAWGEMHASTPGNTLGVVDSVADPGTTTGLMKFHINVSVEPLMQGQLRYAIGDAVMTLNADRIGPSSGNTPPTVTFNDGTFTPSSARGVVSSNNCNVPTQLDGVGIGNNNGTPGCEITVDPSFGSGHFVGRNNTPSPDPMCGSFHSAGLYDVGMVPINVTTISGGKQTIQMSMRRSLPIGSVVYQGGVPGCTWGLDWTGDRSQARNYHQNFVDGTVLPSIGVLDAHTVIVPTYFASGTNYAFTLYPSSHAGTREIATGTTGQKPLAITANLTRTSNKVTGIINITNLPLNMWLGQVFVTVSGCSQTDFNGVKASPPTNQFKMPGPTNNTFTYNDPGADGTCPGAKLVPQGTVVEFRPLSEITSVSNQSTDGSVVGDQSVDGTIWGTFQSVLATIGNNITIPPNYAAAMDMINLNAQAAQPMLQSNPITIIVSANSGQTGFNTNFSSGLAISNIQHPEDMAGTGGNVPPIDAIHIFGPFPFRGLLDSDFAPSPFGGYVINVGPAYGFYYPKTDVNSSFRTYPIMCLSGDDQQFCTNYMLHEIDTNTISFGFNHSTKDQIRFNDHLSEFLIPTGFNSLEIETNLGGVFGGNFVPTGALTQCTTLEPNGFAAGPAPCYRTATTSLGTATPTPGSPFNTRSIYMMIGDDVDGKFASVQYVVPFNASPVTSSFPTTLTCADLPAGATATFYLVQPGISYLPIPGPGCTTSTDTVVDTGTYGAAIGPDPWIAGKILYSGGFAGNEFGFVTSDVFGATGASNRITARIMQASPGLLRIDGDTQGDGLGGLEAAYFKATGGGGLGAYVSTGTTSNQDFAGHLTLSGGGTATYNFTNTNTAAPNCAVSGAANPAHGSATTTVLSLAGTAADVVYWVCIGTTP